MQNSIKSLLINPGEGRQINVGNSKLFVKLGSDSTDNTFSVTEYELPPHFPGPPPHKHQRFEHAWYVLEGALTVQIDEDKSVISKGGFIFIPKRTVHAFANLSEGVVKVLVVDTPGGFEHYYDDLETAFGSGEAIDQQVMRNIQLKYDTYPPDHLFI
ncbi:MAG: cupin domain-containing protein [Williamsia sp.]|nr:cupin domain-containing protein [Williamsia sp.]